MKKSKIESPKPLFHKKSDAGKGDVPRIGVSVEEWSDRWDKIFGVERQRKEKTEKVEKRRTSEANSRKSRQIEKKN